MPLVQRFALIFGAVYLLIGIIGFIPGLRFGGTIPGVIGPAAGYLLGLFAINWFHNLVHVVIGAAGLAVYRNLAGARTYALALGIVYLVVFFIGLFSRNIGAFNGLLPLNGLDDVLHILTAALAFGAYFSTRFEAGRAV